MPLHAIFDDAPRSFGQDDFVFRARLGSLTARGEPVAHQSFRFTTGDPSVGDTLADLYGGTPESWDTKTEESIQLLSDAKKLDVIFESLKSEYTLWGRGKQPIRVCDGTTQSDGKATPCACREQVESVKEHKLAAKAGTACQPTVKAAFRLADSPEIGLGRFQSSSWSLAIGDPKWLKERLAGAGDVWQPPIDMIGSELDDLGGRAMGTLSVVEVSYENKTTKKNFTYTKPFIEITGPVTGDVEALISA